MDSSAAQPMPSAPAPRRTRRIGLVLGLVLALTSLPALVLASHQFADVPTGNPYHADVDALVDAGITNGCSATNYCPTSPVNRGQMAAFLHRGLGVTAASYGEISLADFEASYIAEIDIPAGGVPGGVGYVTVTADVSVLVMDLAICPCGVQIGIDQRNGPGTSPQTWFIVPDAVYGATHANSGTIQWTFQVPSGEEASFGAYANIFTQPIVLEGASTQGISEDPGVLLASMTATYSPFGSVTVPPPVKSDVPSFGEPELSGERAANR